MMTDEAGERSGWQEAGRFWRVASTLRAQRSARLRESSSPARRASDREQSGIFRSAEQIARRCRAEKMFLSNSKHVFIDGESPCPVFLPLFLVLLLLLPVAVTGIASTIINKREDVREAPTWSSSWRHSFLAFHPIKPFFPPSARERHFTWW